MATPPSHGRGGNTLFIRPIGRNLCKLLKNLAKDKIWKQVTEEKKRLLEEKKHLSGEKKHLSGEKKRLFGPLETFFSPISAHMVAI
jgi:hypothetical protein